MSVDTPAWVRDAIFYQIFPDRFAASERVHKPGVLEPWDAPPTELRVQGRRPARHRGAPRLPRGPRGHRDLPDADLPVGLEPPLSHRTTTSRSIPLLGGDDALRELLDARPRPRDAGRPRRRLQPHRPRVLALPSHPRDRRRVAVPRLVPARCRAARRRPPAAGLPAARHAALGPRVRGVVGAAGPAQAQHRQPRGPRVPAAGGGALAALRDRRLAPRRAAGDRRRGVLAGVPTPLPGDPIRCLPRRRDLGGRAGMAAGRSVRRPDELPAGRGDPRLRRRAAARHGRRPPPPLVRPKPATAGRPGIRRHG